MINNLKNKSVVIIGAGKIAKEYVKSLLKLNVKNISIISNKTKKLGIPGFADNRIYSGGYENNLKNFKKIDLLIISTPIPILLPTLKFALGLNIKNILLEKPGSLYSTKLKIMSKLITNQSVCFGYNRICYPSLKKLKTLIEQDGGITSCKFNLTERTHLINLKKYSDEELDRWGLCNPVHVISMVFSLIGFPKIINATQSGYLKWHKTGSSFVGNGISEKNIPFSYHGDWNSSGRWGVEIFTKKHHFKLEPIEELYKNKKGTINWKKISLSQKFPNTKDGITEELEIMLTHNHFKNNLIQIHDAIQIAKFTEKIFGYSSK